MTTYEDYIKIFPKREYEVCERAGILEFDAGLSRKDAEKKAIELNIQEHLRGDDDEGKRSRKALPRVHDFSKKQDRHSTGHWF